jgi:subtilisin family serine protease
VFLLGLPVSTQAPGGGRIVRVNGHEAVEGEVLLKYRSDRIADNHAAIESAADADQVESLDRRGLRRMRSRRLRTTELLSLLKQDPDIEYAEPNYVVRLAATPNDPSFSSLWGLFNNGVNPVGGGGLSGADIDAPAAWDMTTGSRAQVVAIFDTGIDYNHPDLAANVWSAPTPFTVMVGGVSITCAAGTHGFNAITRTCDPMDDQYHGTHVAGTIGAVGNNGVGVTGVNWAASMMGVKFLGASGSGNTSDAIAGIDFVLQTDAIFRSTGKADIRVLSNSWGGGGYSQALADAINLANGSDMLFVAAAGNNGSNNDTSPYYPASYTAPNMVTVASSTNLDQRSSFSNYGATSVHIAAPGSAILSTVPNNAYNVLQGTSMATPQVSGAAMLALSACYLTTAELKSLLLTTVDPVAGFTGLTTTGGRLNVRNVLQNCPHPKASSLTVMSSVASPQELGATITWTASAGGVAGPYQYRWFLWDGTASTMVQNWSSTPTFVWTPSAASGAYQLTVQARGPAQGVAEVSVAKPFVIYTRVSSATLTPNLVAPQPPNTAVTWTATATGGLAPYQYRFLVWGGSAWSELRGWGSSNTLTWTPTVASPDYKIAVLVRGAWNTGANEITVAQPFAIRPVATSVNMNVNPSGAQPLGTTVYFNATASGGQAPYEYQWSLWDGTAWTTVRGWHTASTYNWTPTVANANYRMVVKARSAWNTGAAEIYTQATTPIMPAVSSASLTPSVASPRLLGDTVTFTASASGGQSPYQYRWIASASGVTTTTAWSTSQVFAWTPTTGGTYQIKLQVRSAWNTGAFEREAVLSNYQVRLPLVATLAANRTSPQLAGGTIRWTAGGTGGAMPYQYQWVLFDGTAWINLTAWTTTNFYDWTPGAPGSAYRVGVRVRSDASTGAAESTVILPFVIQ